MGLDGSDKTLNIRAAIDDRILDGTVSPVQSNLALLNGLQIVFFVMVAIVGFFLSILLTRGRKPEYAVMRMLGERAVRVIGKVLLEQLVLCLLGILLGVILVMSARLGHPHPATCCMILACYLLGVTIAAMLTVRVNVMGILRDTE